MKNTLELAAEVVVIALFASSVIGAFGIIWFLLAVAT
jgi:hypothetical protein